MKFWTKEDEAILAEAMKQGLSKEDKTRLARKFGVSKNALRKKINRMSSSEELPTSVSLGSNFDKMLNERDPIVRSVGRVQDNIEKAILDEEDKAWVKLERENEKLRRENTKLRRDKRVMYKEQDLLDDIVEIIKDRCDPIPAVQFGRPDKTINKNEEIVIHISDEHLDSVVPAHRINGLDNYDMRVAFRRAENFVDRIRGFLSNLNYQHKTAWVLLYGDHTSGQIHDAEGTSYFENCLANAIAAGQLHALMLTEFATMFENVNVVYCVGNHGRLSDKKDFRNPLRNLDYLVAETAYARCRNFDNLDFLIPDSNTSVNIEIMDQVFNISHGDDLTASSNMGNAVRKRNERLNNIYSRLNKPVKYKVMGHFHQAANITDALGETIVNGAWLVTDEYAHSLGLASEPNQLIHGITKDGITWQYRIPLRSDCDQRGPKRYNIDMGCKVYERKFQGKGSL